MHYGHFAKMLAVKLGTEERFQQLLKRRMQEANLIPTGPRGMHGLHVDAANAAKLLIGSLISDDVGKAVERFNHYADLPCTDAQGETFVQAIAALIKNAARAKDELIGGFHGFTLHISKSWAVIEVGESTVEYAYPGTMFDRLADRPNVAPFKVGKQVSVRVDPEVVLACAEALGEQE